jgi:predicted P-loop ATPase
VRRIDFGDGRKKDIKQQHWDKDKNDWVMGIGNVQRANIPIYRYADVKKAIANGDYIFIVDGEQCADALWALGLAATTSIGGAGKWRLTDTSDLQGAKVVICPDRDLPGVEDAAKISQHFPGAQWLYCYPESGAWDNLPKSQGLDVKDWIDQEKLSGQDLINAIQPKARSLENSQPLQPSHTQDFSFNRSKVSRLMDLIKSEWGDRLRFNEMTQQVERDGQACRLDLIYLDIAMELDVDINKDKAVDLVTKIAVENTYSPVRDYLNSLADTSPINLDDLALRYFGTNDPLHATLLKRTLIAAVARVFEPGCKVDTLCILQGSQGAMKSTFWQALAGEKYFTDNLSDTNEKDEKLKLRRYWFLEFSEVETAYKRKEVEQLKAFLSSRIDSLRKPYGRSVEDFPRTSVFVGSTNSQEFLHDPTGERRFWVIPVNQGIPIQMLKEERDGIWASAVQSYRAGELWWLTPEEDAQLAIQNKGWQSPDLWEVPIMGYLEHRLECTIPELLTKVIVLEISQQTRREQMRVSQILRRNGWEKSQSQKRIEGKLQWCWQKVVTGCDGVVSEVVSPSNLITATVLPSLTQPITTFLPKLQKIDNEDTKTGDFPSDFKDKESLEKIEKVVSPVESQSQQGLEGDTTSLFPNGGCVTPSSNTKSQSQQGLEGIITPVTTSLSGDTTSLPSQIEPADAEKIREIALVWWPEYREEHLQTLLTQMYGWKSPGNKYNVATIADWLDGEEELVRERITELIHLRE